MVNTVIAPASTISTAMTVANIGLFIKNLENIGFACYLVEVAILTDLPEAPTFTGVTFSPLRTDIMARVT